MVAITEAAHCLSFSLSFVHSAKFYIDLPLCICIHSFFVVFNIMEFFLNGRFAAICEKKKESICKRNLEHFKHKST